MTWLSAAARADDPAPAPAPASEAVDPYEVVVYGELRVEQAHDAVLQQLEDMGYDAQVVDLGDRVVYRHGDGWKGEVVLFDDGWMQVKRQPIRVEGREMPWARRNSALAWTGCVLWPFLCLRLDGASYGERKWRQVEDDSVAALDGKVRQWSDRIADLATQRTVDALPDRLAALWETGRPLSGEGPALATPAERRRALFDYWATRTDTAWGRDVQAAVEAFCRAVVQASDDPFTDVELATFAALHPDPPFDPNRPAAEAE